MTTRPAALAFVGPGLAWMLGLFLVPMLIIATYSVWRVADYAIVPDFTALNYARLTGKLYVDVTLRTFRVAVVTTVLALLIGYPVAFYLAQRVRRFRTLLLILVIMPLWTSYLVRTFAWMLILGRNGVINQGLLGAGLVGEPIEWLLYSDFAVTLALVHIYTPYMILPVYAVLEKLDPRLLEAARDLGAGPTRIFLTVILPLSLPGVATGAIFVFVPSMGAFVTPELLGGTKGVMLGNIIAQQFGGTFEYPFGSALTMLLVTVVMAVAAIGLRLSGGRR